MFCVRKKQTRTTGFGWDLGELGSGSLLDVVVRTTKEHYYLKMTAKLACQQSNTHLSNFTGGLVLPSNIDQGHEASLPFWEPQGEIREFFKCCTIQTCMLGY